MNGMIYTEDSDGRYEMVCKKVWNHFVILLVMIVSTGIFYEKNARTSSAEEIWEM